MRTKHSKMKPLTRTMRYKALCGCHMDDKDEEGEWIRKRRRY